MVRVLLAALAATLVSVTGGIALAQNGGSDNPNKDAHYMMDQCKNGGWEDMGYRNQGQCVREFTPGRS